MKNQISSLRFAGLLAALVATLSLTAHAQYSAYWFDGYDVSANTMDINFEAAVGLRQGGLTVPYVANTANPANDYHHQMFAPSSPLQLAGDAGLPSGFGPALVSPNLSFTGSSGGGIIGKKVEVVMDAFSNAGGSPQEYAWAAITIGSSAPLQAQGAAIDGLSVVFVEDTFGGNGNFIQIWNGGSLLDNLIPNPAGAGGGFVELFVDDLSDGNPWDGIGSTTISVQVNGVPVGGLGPYTIGGGGLTSNFITLEGSQQAVVSNPSILGLHTFDNLTVYTALVPEPSTFGLAGLGIASLTLFRRRKA